MSTDKPVTIEEIRQWHQKQRYWVDAEKRGAVGINHDHPTMIMYRHIDFLLSEVDRLKAENEQLPPHKTINLLTTLEHQVYRNHQFLPDGCSECSITETIVKKLGEELGL